MRVRQEHRPPFHESGDENLAVTAAAAKKPKPAAGHWLAAAAAAAAAGRTMTMWRF